MYDCFHACIESHDNGICQRSTNWLKQFECNRCDQDGFIGCSKENLCIHSTSYARKTVKFNRFFVNSIAQLVFIWLFALLLNQFSIQLQVCFEVYEHLWTHIFDHFIMELNNDLRITFERPNWTSWVFYLFIYISLALRINLTALAVLIIDLFFWLLHTDKKCIRLQRSVLFTSVHNVFIRCHIHAMWMWSTAVKSIWAVIRRYKPIPLAFVAHRNAKHHTVCNYDGTATS